MTERIVAKLLIVDDEKNTRESLRELVPWHTVGVSSVRTARNGAEALALAGQDPPDVLLTDVRMPKMDGIELATRVRELFPLCQIVFLSGYADKDYLKTAIRLRAVSYIEKPIDIAEVADVVASALSLRREERSLLEGRRLAAREVASALVRPGADIGALRARFGDALPEFPAGAYLTAAVVTLAWRGEDKGQGRSEALARLLEVCAGIPPFDLPTTLVGAGGAESLLIILPRRVTEAIPSSTEPFVRLLEELQRAAPLGAALSIGIGVPVTASAGLPRSYESAAAAARRQFYEGQGRILFPRPAATGTFAADPGLYDRFRLALRDSDVGAASGIVAELRAAAQAAACDDVDSVRNAFFNLLLALLDATWERMRANPLDPSQRSYVWQEIREQRTLDETARFVVSHLDGLFGGGEKIAGLPRKVIEIQRFVRGSFCDSRLSLQAIADAVALSRTYLSALFRAHTGTTVSDYVTRLRIDRARELLGDPTLKTYDVAMSVGFANAGYFATVFRKEVGCTPSEYRNR